MLPEFSSRRAESKEEAIALLSRIEDAVVLAGGTDLLVRMQRGEIHGTVLDLGAVAELAHIGYRDGVLAIGCLATHRAVAESVLVRHHAPSLARASAVVGSPQIRNMGTIGGNLANASPAADTLAPLLVHDALVVLESQDGERKVRVEDFIVAPYRTCMKKGELLTRIEVTGPGGSEEGYKRVAKRAAWAISRLSVAWIVNGEDGFYGDVRLAVGSCTPVPMRFREAERFLGGRERSEKTIAEAAAMIVDGIRRMTGERQSHGYKLPVVHGLLTAVLRGEPCM